MAIFKTTAPNFAKAIFPNVESLVHKALEAEIQAKIQPIIKQAILDSLKGWNIDSVEDYDGTVRIVLKEVVRYG